MLPLYSGKDARDARDSRGKGCIAGQGSVREYENVRGYSSRKNGCAAERALGILYIFSGENYSKDKDTNLCSSFGLKGEESERQARKMKLEIRKK